MWLIKKKQEPNEVDPRKNFQHISDCVTKQNILCTSNGLFKGASFLAFLEAAADAEGDYDYYHGHANQCT